MKISFDSLYHSRWSRIGLVFMIAAAISLLALKAKVQDWPYTDPKGSLMSGQALLETGSFNLKPYESELDHYYWQVLREKDEILYAYPMGNTLLHLPFIWIATKCGVDLTDHHQEAELNRVFAALSLFFAFLLTYSLFRRRTGIFPSLIFSVVIILGSNVFSTMGLALWNINYAVVFSLLVLYILDSKRLMQFKDTGWILGILLFLGFIVRPSFALLILVTFGYLIRYNKLQFLRTATVSALLLLVYILFSLGTFKTILPGHYQLQDISAMGQLVPNFLAHFFSPSRGFFIFSPIFIFTFVGGYLYSGKFKNSPVIGLSILWMILLLLSLSSWFMWWGGGGFGNRLLTETLPAWIFLSSYFWPDLINQTKASLHKGICWGSFAVLAVFSGWVHVVQGANNQWTVTWFQQPNKDVHPEYFWNYRFPQFLASENQITDMLEWHRVQTLLQCGKLFQTIPVSEPELKFTGWGSIEGGDNPFRWTIGRNAIIHIPDNAIGLPLESMPEWYVLAFEGRTFLNQDIDVYVNRQLLCHILTSRKSPQDMFFTEPFTIKHGESLDIELLIRNPKVPADEFKRTSKDSRELGLRLYNIQLRREPLPAELSGSH